MHSATWSPSSPSSLAYCKFDSPASSAEQGTRLSHYRGQGPVPPQGVHRKELAGLLESLAWSSFKGEEANLVSPFSPVCGGLMGGALREALPTSFSVASLGICATIDPALTRHLSDSAHNDIVRALRAAPELIDHHDLHNGRC
ncbi:MAG TPA: hypothetical protein VF169_11115, partial [Albitalea sp.]|uniref:hypothetical protein n=1 Tax=Piscinibacter sp. TaxID=1903157 RepID=UPI002ED5C2DC